MSTNLISIFRRKCPSVLQYRCNLQFCKQLRRKFSDKSLDVKSNEGGGNPGNLLRQMITPTNFHKKILVFSGRYKNVEEIPDKITGEALDKAKNKARIKIANYMIVATFIGCICMAFAGRRAAERGESLTKMNLDWHKEMNKKIDEERALANEALKK